MSDTFPVPEGYCAITRADASQQGLTGDCVDQSHFGWYCHARTGQCWPNPSAEPFRTATGQTGIDAYIYEATQIANAQRDLNRRMLRLANTIKAEQSALPYRHSIATERFPDAESTGDLMLLLPEFFTQATQASMLCDMLMAHSRGTVYRDDRSDLA
jgi:hypothetical protein